MAFKVLHCLLVFFRGSFRLKRAKISSLSRLRIFLAGMQPVFAGFQLADHCSIGYSQMKSTPRVELWGNRFGCQIRTRRERMPYKGFGERFETQRTSSAARIPRFVAR
jgi:hypothetical protein